MTSSYYIYEKLIIFCNQIPAFNFYKIISYQNKRLAINVNKEWLKVIYILFLLLIATFNLSMYVYNIDLKCSQQPF